MARPWHAAGLVGQLRSSRNTTRMLEHSVELYARLEAEDRSSGRLASGRPACGWRARPERSTGVESGSRRWPRASGCRWRSSAPSAPEELFPVDDDPTTCSPACLPSDGWIHRSGKRHPGDREGCPHAQTARICGAHQGPHRSPSKDGRGIHCSPRIRAENRLRDGGQCCGPCWGMEIGADGQACAFPAVRRRAPVRG